MQMSILSTAIPPQLHSSLPSVAAGRTGLLSASSTQRLPEHQPPKPLGVAYNSSTIIHFRSASVVGAAGLRPRLSPGVQRAVVEVTRCRH